MGSVVGSVCVGGQKSGRLIQWSILMLCEGQLDLGELAVRGLRCLVHARRHQGVLILLAGHLGEGEQELMSYNYSGLFWTFCDVALLISVNNSKLL